MKKILRKIAGLFMVALMTFSTLSPMILALEESGKIEFNKTAEKIGDEQTSREAEITLSVSGNSFSLTKPTDVVLVLDRSGSMDDKLGGTAKRVTAQEAAEDLVDELIPETNKGVVRISIVSFGYDVGTVTNLTSNKQTLKNAIDSVYGSSIGSAATNVHSGLIKAEDILSSSTGNKIVILLSDGIPTRYTHPTYGVVGDGNYDTTVCLDYEWWGCDKWGEKPSDVAIRAANALKASPTNATVYSIGFGTIDADTTTFLTSVASVGQYYSAFDSEALSTAFDNIVSDIDAIATDVVVSDTVPEGFIVDEKALKDTYKDAVTITKQDNKTVLTWNIKKLDATKVNELKYKVTAKDGYYGSMFTNEGATITGKPAEGNPYYTGDIAHTFPKPFITVPGVAKADSYAATAGVSLVVSSENGLLNNDSFSKMMTDNLNLDSQNPDSIANRIVAQTDNLCGTIDINTATGAFTYEPSNDCVASGASSDVSFTYYVETSIIKDGNETTVRSNTATVTINVSKQETKYKVKYLEKETEKSLAAAQEFDGLVGDTVTVNAIDIKGYNRVSAPSKSLQLEESGNEIIFYYEKKPAVVSENSVSKTGTISIDRKNINVDYKISYTAKIADYMGDATVTIVDTLPYMIDVTKSELAGGEYDAENNTITWTKTISNIDTYDYEKGIKEITINKDISVSYIGIDITAETLENKVEGQIKLDDTETVKVNNSFNTQVNIKGTLKIYYVDTNGDELLETKEDSKKAGTSYKTAPEVIDGYEVIKVDGVEAGTYSDSLIEVVYTYDRVKAIVSEENTSINKIGTESITSKNDQFSYTITYHTEFDNYIGNGKLTIVDKLPYELDTSKPHDLKGGKYNNENKTITWEVAIEDINTYENGVKKVNFNKTISFYYKNIDIESETIINSVESKLELDTIDDVVNKISHTTNVDIKGNLIVRYVDEENKELLESVETIEKAGTSYETSKIDITDYDFVRVIGNEKGKYTDDTIIVTYVYTRKKAKVTDNNITKQGDVSISNKELSVKYDINYQAKIEDYMGTATVTIVDTLPYMIDITKSELADGEYDAENNTITWTETISNINTYKNGIKEINISKNIELFYLGIDITSYDFTNKVSGNLELETAIVDPNESEFKTNVDIKGNLIVRYVDEAGNDLLPMIREEQKAGTSYKTKKEIIKGYTLKDVVGECEGQYSDETKEVTYIYERTKTEYVIKYLENGTNKELLESKINIAYVGDEIVEKALSIDGYVLASNDSVTIVLDEQNNEIIFYYDRVYEVVSTGIIDYNDQYNLLLIIFSTILTGLVVYKKRKS